MDFERTSSGGQFVDMAASKHAHRQQRICGYGCGELHSIVQSGSIWLELAMKFRARDVRGLWAARHMLVNHCMSSKWERKSPKPNKISSYTTEKTCPDEQTHDENSVALDDGVENLVW